MAIPDSRSRALALWLPALVFFGAACALTVAFHHPLPFQDQWDLLHYWDRLQRGEFRAGELFEDHNGHWIVLARAVLLGLARLTHMSHLAEACANLVVSGLGGLALIAMTRRVAAAADAQARLGWLIGVSSFFYFSLDQAPNYLWGWQLAVFFNVAGAVAAVWLLARADLKVGHVAAAAAAAAVAVYDFATGLALLPAGALLILASPTPAKRRIALLVLWLAFSAAVTGHYLAQVAGAAAGGEPRPAPGAGDLAALLLYGLNFLGGAVGRFSDGLAPGIAVLGLVVAGLAARSVLAGPGGREAVLAPAGLMLYGAGAAALTAFGRLGFGAEQALVSRYISFSNLFWIGLLMLTILAAARAGSKAGRRAYWSFVVLVLLLKLGNISNVVIDKDVAGDHARLAEAARRIAADYPNLDPAVAAAVSAPTQDIRPRIETLKRDRLSIFRDR